ncbi:helix-turn-helix domain-containing protein [Patescibacteria group bacterium]|nr:helix-turn-helix domain-containing protein [Patescibacteria group bacterium]
MVTQNFGEFLRLKRIELGFTLRSFSFRFNYDPGNISRLERNILPPSLDNDKLAALATALQIKRGSEEWIFFHDLAHIAKKQIPQDIIDNAGVNKILPLLFRTVRGKKLSKEKLSQLIKLLKKT